MFLRFPALESCELSDKRGVEFNTLVSLPSHDVLAVEA
jgi:hypothetical protein